MIKQDTSKRIGIDIGGTFTDFVIFDSNTGETVTFKLLSTPKNPAKAMLEGLEKIPSEIKRKIIHGSTVATNALLEGKGARTALITTKGFRDVLHIGRQNRSELYDLFADPPPPLIPYEWRLEIDEMVIYTGEITSPINTKEVDECISFLKNEKINSVAVCLLFSFLDNSHEQMIAKLLRKEGFFTSISSDVLPVFREYERTSTTVVNAYVSPILDKYIEELEDNLPNDDLHIMQSNGGSISPKEARSNAVRCILSGPAGGVVGAHSVASAAGFDKIITFDMGGTSTDVSLVDGKIRVNNEADIGGHPVRIPILDIHTVGSGGGSIARADSGGALRVGPESAGAEPGPACYGKGALPTVTDANLVLGLISADFFLGGKMKLDEKASKQAFTYLGEELQLQPEDVALGVIRVANAHMERALRVISIERGHDPRDFTLVSFGGAGGLHASDLARGLNIPRVLVPPYAATLSALGMLMADIVKDYSQTVMLPGITTFKEIVKLFDPIIQKGQKEMALEGIREENILIETTLDIRYEGQSYELNVLFNENFIERFHLLHDNNYGYANKRKNTELVNLRVRVIGRVNKPTLKQWTSAPIEDPSPAFIIDRKARFKEDIINIPFFDGERLIPGNIIPGPAIILRNDTTILIKEPDTGRVDNFKNIIIDIGGNK